MSGSMYLVLILRLLDVWSDILSIHLKNLAEVDEAPCVLIRKACHGAPGMGTGAEALGSGRTGDVGTLPLPVVGGELLPPVTVPFCRVSPACSMLCA